MTTHIYVATRKGLITYFRTDKGWQSKSVDYLGDPVSMSLYDPRDGTLYAALYLGHFGPKLHRSDDDGKSWHEIAAPKFAEVADEAANENGDASPTVDMIWSLETGGNDEPGVLWAGTIPGALFRSADQGDSWELVESLWNRPEREEWFGGGYDSPGIHSICVDPRNSKRVLAAVSCGGVWLTEDGGESWNSRAKGMRAAFLPPERAYDPNVQDPHRMVACPSHPDKLWVQHHNGIFKSDDDAVSWREIEDVEPSVFGFAVVVHPREPNTAWFVPAIKDECRVPVRQKFVVTRTRDGGKTFESLDEGLPEQSYDLVYRHGLAIDESGDCLAMGSTTGNFWISEDQGDSWEQIAGNLPPIYSIRFR